MNLSCTDTPSDVRSKLKSASSLCLNFLLPKPEILQISEEIGHTCRDRTYNPMTVVWIFIIQVLSADPNSQQAVTRFNAWRVARGFLRVSSETTSYRKARRQLPEVLFERLLLQTARRCEEATDEAWLFHGRIVEMFDGWTLTMADTDENPSNNPT